MKILIIILIIISFLQSTTAPLDLILIILICRSYLKADKASLYLAFAFGQLVSSLDLRLLGLQSMIYLSAVWLIQVLSRSRLAGNPFLLIPISFICLSINSLINSTPSFPTIIVESLISLPIFYIVRLWEERFTIQKGIKLRI